MEATIGETVNCQRTSSAGIVCLSTCYPPSGCLIMRWWLMEWPTHWNSTVSMWYNELCVGTSWISRVTHLVFSSSLYCSPPPLSPFPKRELCKSWWFGSPWPAASITHSPPAEPGPRTCGEEDTVQPYAAWYLTGIAPSSSPSLPLSFSPQHPSNLIALLGCTTHVGRYVPQEFKVACSCWHHSS